MLQQENKPPFISGVGHSFRILRAIREKYRKQGTNDQVRSMLDEALNDYIATNANKDKALETPDVALCVKLRSKIQDTPIEDLLTEFDKGLAELIEQKKLSPQCTLQHFFTALLFSIPIDIAIKQSHLKKYVQEQKNKYRSLSTVRTKKSAGPTFFPKDYTETEFFRALKELIDEAKPFVRAPSITVPPSLDLKVIKYLASTPLKNYKVIAGLSFSSPSFAMGMFAAEFSTSFETERMLNILGVVSVLEWYNRFEYTNEMYDFLLECLGSKDAQTKEKAHAIFLKVINFSKPEKLKRLINHSQFIGTITNIIKLITLHQEELTENELQFLIKVHGLNKDLVDLADVEEKYKNRFMAGLGGNYCSFGFHYSHSLAVQYEKAFARKIVIPLEVLPALVYMPRVTEEFSVLSFRNFLFSVHFDYGTSNSSNSSFTLILQKILKQFQMDPQSYLTPFYAEMFFMTAERFDMGMLDIISFLDGSKSTLFSLELRIKLILIDSARFSMFCEKTTVKQLENPAKTLFKIDDHEFGEIHETIMSSANPGLILMCLKLFNYLPRQRQIELQNNSWEINAWKSVGYFCSNVDKFSEVQVNTMQEKIAAIAKYHSSIERLEMLVWPLENWLEDGKLSLAVKKSIKEILVEIYNLPMIEAGEVSTFKETGMKFGSR